MEDQHEGKNEEETPQEPEHDPSLLPERKLIGKPFGPDNQPSSEAKKKGWLKKKRNRELVQYLLSRPWKKSRMNKDLDESMKEFFNISDEEAEELTYEAVMYLKQMAMAIKHGDNTAAAMLYERAFGKPVQTIDFGGSDTPPAINITVGDSPDVPPIADTDNEDEPLNETT